MYRIASYVKVYFDDRTEECTLTSKTEFSTIESAERNAHKKFCKSKKHRHDLEESRIALGAKAISKFSVVVDEDDENVNDHYWLTRIGPEGFDYQ